MTGIKVEVAIRHSQSRKRFPLKLLKRLVDNILVSESFTELLIDFRVSYLEPFRNLRINVLQCVGPCICDWRRCIDLNESVKPSDWSRRFFSLLRIFPNPTEESELLCEETDMESFSTTTLCPDAYKTAYLDAWCCFLDLCGKELKLSPTVYREVLTVLPNSVLPFMPSPLRLSRFFLLSFHENDLSIAVEALSGLFYLLVSCGLAEPQLVADEGIQFYDRLLSLLQPQVFFLPVRVRFLRLLQMSLLTKLLPHEMKAVFIKKLVAGDK